MTLGELNLDLGNARRGAELLERAARLRPREFGVWRLLGHAFNDANDPDGAEVAYQKALELRPKDREMLTALIGLLINNGRSARAGPWIDRAFTSDPDDPVVLGLAARGPSRRIGFDDALALADRALKGDPQNPDALLARAHCRTARAQWKAALPDAERTAAAGAQRSPTAPGARHHRGPTGIGRAGRQDPSPTRSGPASGQVDGRTPKQTLRPIPRTPRSPGRWGNRPRSRLVLARRPLLRSVRWPSTRIMNRRVEVWRP